MKRVLGALLILLFLLHSPPFLEERDCHGDEEAQLEQGIDGEQEAFPESLNHVRLDEAKRAVTQVQLHIEIPAREIEIMKFEGATWLENA
jgi:hypothetical protein